MYTLCSPHKHPISNECPSSVVPRRFPVEAALGVVFFIIAVLNLESSAFGEKASMIKGILNSDVLFLFVPLVALSFWLLMLVLDQFCIDDSIVTHVSNMSFNLFKKL